MKKYLAAALAALVLLTAACQNNDTQNSKSDKSIASSSSVSTASERKDSESSAVSSVESSGKTSESDKTDPDDIFNFYNYQSDDVFDIGKADLSGDISEESVKNAESLCMTYKFKFYSDDYRIKAYISIPKKCIEEQKPCKAIIYCRGGNSNLDILHPAQITAFSLYTGRVTIGCELRGCNGTEGLDQFGGDELNDVIKLIDLCQKNFSFIDMDDLCVAGISRGGLMTYMAARRDERVKKALVISGVSDLIATFNEREEKMINVLITDIGGTPEEMPEEYKKRSALYWAEEIKIPVMIIHSTGDKRADYETQALKIAEKLKKTTDCTFITHEDDYHGLQKVDLPAINDFLNK